MLNLSNLKPKQKKKQRRRVGRGPGSGRGTYSGRGMKGQKARTGGSIPPGFEGGRMPLIRQIPKRRGFKSIHPKAQPVNLLELEQRFNDGEVVSPKTLKAKGLVTDEKQPVKILGLGKLTKKLVFEKVRLSAQAKETVAKAGGEIK